MVLPDTSVWVEYSRRGAEGAAAAMHELLDRGEAATCGPVVAELLAGAEGEVGERMWETLDSLPWAEMPPRAWRQVGSVAGALRRKGESLPLTDVTIAVAAVRADHALWSFDSDFERIRAVLPELSLYDPAVDDDSAAHRPRSDQRPASGRGPPDRGRWACDIDLLVIAEGGHDRYGHMALELAFKIAQEEGDSPVWYSVIIYSPERLRDRRETRSSFIQEVDRDKLVLAGSALE